MSVRVHNGYRLTAGTNPFTFIATARTALDPVRDDLDLKSVADAYARAVDDAAVHGTPLPSLISAVLAHDNDQAQRGKDDWLKDPHAFELSFGLDPDTDRYGVLLFTSNRALEAAFEALPEVEAYPYWDNADEPVGMSAERWQARGQFWAHLLPRDRLPAESMLGWSLRSTGSTLQSVLLADNAPAQVLTRMPEMAARARRVARVGLLERASSGQGRTARHVLAVDDAVGDLPDLLEAAGAVCVPVSVDLMNRPQSFDVASLAGARARLDAQLREAAEAFAAAR